MGVMLFALTWLTLAAGWLLVSRAPRRQRLLTHPARRAWLMRQGLVRPAEFLALQALVVSGHVGRQVLRLRLGEDATARTVYLKRQRKVKWTERLRNFVHGRGWDSNSLREAKLLDALGRRGLPAPRWIAAGEDGGGAFLLVEDVADAVALPQAVEAMNANDRRGFAARLGRILAQLHDAGFVHRDLYAKHVLVKPSGDVAFIDWQRSMRRERLTDADRVRDLATLHATMPNHLASWRERLTMLRAYLGSSKGKMRPFAAAIEREAARLLGRRHVREKRQASDAEQAWECRDGDALCVAPSMADAFPGEADWLSLDRQPGERSSRRWLQTPGGGLALLVRRRGVGATCSQRDAMLLWRLQRHGVAAPRVLAVGRRRDDSFLLTQPIAGATRLLTWLRRPSPLRLGALRQVGELLAKLHEGCCYLGDAGLDRLAVVIATTHVDAVLDAVDGLSPCRKPSERRARHDLVALRGAALAAGCTADEFLTCEVAYSTRRGTDAPASFWQRMGDGWRRLRHAPDWPALAGDGWADRIMGVPVTDRFFAKQGRSTGRLVLEAAAGRLVVYLKRHYHLPLFSRLMALVWPGGDWSPAMQEFNHLQWARRQGVPVPRPVAAGEFIGPGLSLRSFLAVEELTGMLPLHEAVPLAASRLAPDELLRWKRGLIAELARLSRLLHDRRHFHKDLYLCHFYVHADDLATTPVSWRGRVSLIDLHRLSKHRRTWPMWVVKDLAQLLYSSDVPGVTARDRLRFWKHYRPAAASTLWRWLRAAVVFKWRRYVRHNRKRQNKA